MSKTKEYKEIISLGKAGTIGISSRRRRARATGMLSPLWVRVSRIMRIIIWVEAEAVWELAAAPSITCG